MAKCGETGMKLTIDLDDLDTGADWTETVGSILREEIDAMVRKEIRSALKSQRGAISAKVTKAIDSASKDIQAHALKSLSERLGAG
jgi:hypothetical protein